MKDKVKGYISNKTQDYVYEKFKGEVSDKVINWPKELGTDHPFNFESVENVWKKVGLLNGVINKITDNIVGEFTINSKDPKILTLVKSFIKDTNFKIKLREWIREGLVKGNGFMEIDLKNAEIRVLNANQMYVKRNIYGDVVEYNQWVGDLKRFNVNSKKLINFKPSEIAQLPINAVAGEAYGLGIIWPNERTIENMILCEQDYQKMINRKAGAPIHVKFGKPGESVSSSAIDDMANKLRFMNNKTEWVTDGNTEMNVLDFGEIGKNITEIINYYMKLLLAGIDVPEVLLNSGQLNEGIAKVQLEGWQRRIVSYQDMIESVITERIFNPYLESNGLKGEIDFIWNLPGEEEKNLRLDKLNMILGNPAISENMKRMVQLEMARVLNFQDAETFLIQPEKGLDEQQFDKKEQMFDVNLGDAEKKQEDKIDKEREKEKDLVQPEIPGEKEHGHIHLDESEGLNLTEMTIREFINLQEIKGFNYSDYLISILKRVRTDKFEDLHAKIEEDISKGLLPDNDIRKLRTILKEGFRRNQTMREIESNIRENIKLNDRIAENGAIIQAANRPEMIARTEVVRLSNEGLKDLFKQNHINKIQWLAAVSDRTCERCMELNGQVINMTETFKQGGDSVFTPPLHVGCRCSLLSVVT